MISLFFYCTTILQFTTFFSKNENNSQIIRVICRFECLLLHSYILKWG